MAAGRPVDPRRATLAGGRPRRLPLLAVVALIAGLGASSAEAQGPRAARPSTAVLRTARSSEVPAELAETLDRALRAEVAAHGGVEVRGSVTLDLADLQLALGCEGESTACLGAVARELSVRTLLVPHLDRAGTQLVLHVALFDAEAEGEAVRATRTASADDPAPLLEGLAGMVVELFGEPATEATVEGTEDTGGTPSERGAPRAGDEAGLVGGGVIAALGVAVLGVGIGLGAASLGEADAYASHPIETETGAAEALAHYRSASDLAIGANVAFALGGAAAIGGLIWCIVALSAGGEASDAPVQAQVFASPWGGGIALAGALPEETR